MNTETISHSADSDQPGSLSNGGDGRAQLLRLGLLDLGPLFGGIVLSRFPLQVCRVTPIVSTSNNERVGWMDDSHRALSILALSVSTK